MRSGFIIQGVFGKSKPVYKYLGVKEPARWFDPDFCWVDHPANAFVFNEKDEFFKMRLFEENTTLAQYSSMSQFKGHGFSRNHPPLKLLLNDKDKAYTKLNWLSKHNALLGVLDPVGDNLSRSLSVQNLFGFISGKCITAGPPVLKQLSKHVIAGNVPAEVVTYAKAIFCPCDLDPAKIVGQYLDTEYERYAAISAVCTNTEWLLHEEAPPEWTSYVVVTSPSNTVKYSSYGWND